MLKSYVAKTCENTEAPNEETAKIINYGDYNEVISSFKNETVRARLAAQKETNEIMIEMEGERVRKQYGNISDLDVLKVLRVEKEKLECKNCKGLPCLKKEQPLYVPKLVKNIERNRFEIVYAEKCGYEKMRLLNRKYGLAKIPPEYIGKTFDDYSVDINNEHAVKAAKKLIECTNKGAYFYGEVGTGKTYLAAIIAQELIQIGREVIFATVPTISMQIRSTFKNNTVLSESEILEKLYTVPTLILDDIGMEKPTRFVCSTLCNIFNERYNARLQTIMTSNYTLEQIKQIFNNPTDGGKEKILDGTRIYDRCKQMCFPIELKGNSRR